MADNNGAKTPGGRPAVDKKAKANDLKEVKILMLHGKFHECLVYPDCLFMSLNVLLEAAFPS
jgi:hypothetical protein